MQTIDFLHAKCTVCTGTVIFMAPAGDTPKSETLPAVAPANFAGTTVACCCGTIVHADTATPILIERNTVED
jgi:hypothetical protein